MKKVIEKSNRGCKCEGEASDSRPPALITEVDTPVKVLVASPFNVKYSVQTNVDVYVCGHVNGFIITFTTDDNTRLYSTNKFSAERKN